MTVFPDFYETKIIQHHECGPNSHLKIKDLLDYLQDAAAQHADTLGVGFEQVNGQKMLWVLSRLKVSIEQNIKVNQPFKLRSFPSGINRLFAIRQFAMTTPDDQFLLKATSYWLLLNAESFRPLKPAVHLPPEIQNPGNRPQYFQDLPKIDSVKITEPREIFRVNYSDIDENGHLNNAFYGRYIYDILAQKLNDFPSIHEFQINYNHQALLNNKIYCGCSKINDQQFYIDGLSEDLQTCYFQAICTLRK